MKADKNIISLIEKIDPLKLSAYLKYTGWSSVDVNKNGKIYLFQREDHSYNREVMFASSRSYSDYFDRMYETILYLSEFENRRIIEVAKDIVLDPSDIIRVAVSGEKTITGTIPYNEGFDLIEGLKRMVYTAACDIVKPTVYHKKLGIKTAQQFIESCLLGQTEIGSFVASVICPFVESNKSDTVSQLSIFDDELALRSSFTRKVTSKVLTSIEIIKAKVESGNEEDLVSQSGDNIISANFIESVLDLNSLDIGGELEISSSWSIFALENAIPKKSVKIDSGYNASLKSMIEKMRPQDTGIEDVFFGRISQNKANPDVTERESGEITFNFIRGEEEKVSKAKIRLNAEDYNSACKAHQDGRQVKVTGKLVISGKTKTIENVTIEIL